MKKQRRTGNEKTGTHRLYTHKVIRNRWKQSRRGRQSTRQAHTQGEGMTCLKQEERWVSRQHRTQTTTTQGRQAIGQDETWQIWQYSWFDWRLIWWYSWNGKITHYFWLHLCSAKPRQSCPRYTMPVCVRSKHHHFSFVWIKTWKNIQNPLYPFIFFFVSNCMEHTFNLHGDVSVLPVVLHTYTTHGV